MSKTKQYNQLVKELLLDSRHKTFYKETNDITNYVVNFFKELNLKEGVEVGYDFNILSRYIDLTIEVEDIDEDITPTQMYKLSTMFGSYRIPFEYQIEIKEPTDYMEYVGSEEVFYIYDNNYEQNTGESVRKFSETYHSIKPTQFSDMHLTYHGEIVNGKLRGVLYYGLGNGRDYTVEEQIISMHLSTQINIVEDLTTKELLEIIQRENKVEVISDKEDVLKETEKVKTYFNKYINTIKKKGGLDLGTQYTLTLSKHGVVLDVVLNWFDIDMNYMNKRTYKQDIIGLGIEHINVNVVINNQHQMFGGYHERNNRKDVVIEQQTKSVKSMGITEEVDELVSLNLGKPFSITDGLGIVQVDITKQYQDMQLVKDYDWTLNMGMIKGHKLVLRVQYGNGGSYNFSKEETKEIKSKLKKDNVLNVYNYFFKGGKSNV